MSAFSDVKYDHMKVTDLYKWSVMETGFSSLSCF